MRETVGVRSFVSLFRPDLIKRDALMFKKIGVLGCDRFVKLADEFLAATSPQLNWLVEQGIIFDLPVEVLYDGNPLDDETKKVLDDSRKLITYYEEEIGRRNIVEDLKPYLDKEFSRQGLSLESLEDVFKNPDSLKQFSITLLFGEAFLRPLTAYYRNTQQMDAYSLFYAQYSELVQQTADLGDIIDITIHQLPIPDDSTSWEQILDFRNDPDTEKKFLGLRVWMNEIARAKLSPLEIEQKLEWLLQEYQDHMKLHRMKTNASTLETIIVTGAEIAESVVKFQFGKAAKILFSLRHRKLSLLEAELKSPGREIAFISKAQETFR
jgi:hypothetical protein